MEFDVGDMGHSTWCWGGESMSDGINRIMQAGIDGIDAFENMV